MMCPNVLVDVPTLSQPPKGEEGYKQRNVPTVPMSRRRILVVGKRSQNIRNIRALCFLPLKIYYQFNLVRTVGTVGTVQ